MDAYRILFYWLFMVLMQVILPMRRNNDMEANVSKMQPQNSIKARQHMTTQLGTPEGVRILEAAGAHKVNQRSSC